uniref:Secreted protein n=1 Tax=Kalanchoe fedtschenkoi TaxID=63787 RepID=A0A7N0UIU8_KALFE
MELHRFTHKIFLLLALNYCWGCKRANVLASCSRTSSRFYFLSTVSFFLYPLQLHRRGFFFSPNVLGPYPTQWIEVPHSTLVTNQSGSNPQLTDNRSVALQKFMETRERRNSS